MVGEVQRRLTGRVAGSDKMDIEPVGDARLAPRCAVVGPLADEAFEAFDFELAPGDAGRDDDRSGAQDVVTIEETSWLAGSMRVIERVTNISAPSRLAC